MTIDLEGTIMSKYTFENFVVGKNNEFAYKIAKSVAEKKMSYNLFFIYGDVGVGKTHLMYAIVNQITRDFPNENVVYLTAEEFTNQLINSIKKKKYEQFRRWYRNIDFLLIDDIQFIVGKERIEEVVLNVCDFLYHNQKKIVIASSCKINNFIVSSQRLKTRFANGVLDNISMQEYKTRQAILVNKIKDENIEINKEILTYIVKKSNLSIRAMMGLVNTIKAHKDLIRNSIPEEKIKMLIDDMLYK